MKADDVALIVLAAGRSERFGTEDKLLADLHGQPLGLHTPQRLAPMKWATKIAVTLGELAGPLQDLGFVIVAPLQDGGLGDNIAKAVSALNRPQSVLICLADMPFVTLTHIEEMMAAMSADRSIVASQGAGVLSPPVLFGVKYFESLLVLSGDIGARDVIVANKPELALVPATRTTLMDVDTLALLAEARLLTNA